MLYPKYQFAKGLTNEASALSMSWGFQLVTSGKTTTYMPNNNWTWQGGANRLTTFTNASGITMTFDYYALRRITRRYTTQGYSDYIYDDGTDWLLRETWHATTSGAHFTL